MILLVLAFYVLHFQSVHLLLQLFFNLLTYLAISDWWHCFFILWPDFPIQYFKYLADVWHKSIPFCVNGCINWCPSLPSQFLMIGAISVSLIPSCFIRNTLVPRFQSVSFQCICLFLSSYRSTISGRVCLLLLLHLFSPHRAVMPLWHLFCLHQLALLWPLLFPFANPITSCVTAFLLPLNLPLTFFLSLL